MMRLFTTWLARQLLPLLSVIAGVCLASPAMGQLQNPTWAGPAGGVTRPVIDVAMDGGGNLHGAVRDAAGNVIPAARVALLKDYREYTTSVTDADGRFVIGGLRGGVYLVEAEEGSTLVRAWSLGSAPPGARPLVNVQGSIVRGQFTPYGVPIYNPWAVTAAAGLAGGLAVGLYTLDSGS